jgi:hypothetical protein
MLTPEQQQLLIEYSNHIAEKYKKSAPKSKIVYNKRKH